MTSVLNVDTIADKAGTGPATLTKQSAAKAYANFSASAIVKSLNYSSFTDNGTGDHTLTVTSALDDANYIYGGFSRSGTTTSYCRGNTPDGEDPTTTQQRYHACLFTNGTLEDQEANFTAVHGDLA